MDRVPKIGFSGTLGITQKMGDKLPFYPRFSSFSPQIFCHIIFGDFSKLQRRSPL